MGLPVTGTIAQDANPAWPTQATNPIQSLLSPGGAAGGGVTTDFTQSIDNTGTVQQSFPGNVSISGNITIGGTATMPSLALTNLNVSGTITAGGVITGNRFSTAGALAVGGVSTLSGNVNVGGILSAPSAAITSSLSIASAATIGPSVAGNPVAIIGGTNGAVAPAGQLGEYLNANRASGSALGLTTSVIANVASLALTAGDWEISGLIAIGGTSTVATALAAGLTTASATLPAVAIGDGASYVEIALASGAVSPNTVLPLNPVRLVISTATTIYLNVITIFASGTVTAYGQICARRMR